MKYCSRCGTQHCDDAVVCTHCGCAFATNKRYSPVAGESSGTKTAVKVFLILTLVSFGVTFLSTFMIAFGYALISLIPLCWVIPMTKTAFHSMKYNQPLSTTFKVCTLLFVNLIAGIIMLCDQDI